MIYVPKRWQLVWEIGTDQGGMVMINVYGSGITNYCLNSKTTFIAASPKLWDNADYVLSDHWIANLMVIPK